MSERTLRSLKVNARDAVTRLSTVSRRPAALDLDRSADVGESPIALDEDLLQRRHELLDFYAHYEELIELLADAAQYGPTPKLESDYQRLRGTLQRGYQRIRCFVVAFLKYSPEDAQIGVGLWGRSADAFEALTAAATLRSFLRSDDGCLLSRISRTRDALNRYGDHLHRLSAQS